MGPDTDHPRIAMIIVNWNGADETIGCIGSLDASRQVPWRIYVIDNASTDDSVARIRSACPQVVLIQATRNGGYAAAFNQGRARALADGAEYLYLLNNDTYVDPEALSALLDAHARQGPAIFAPLILHADPPQAVWSAGGYLDWELKSYHLAPETQDSPGRDVVWATGCALFCSADVARLVGPMDERYFLYLEDVDWCLRARRRGIRTRLVSNARVYHRVSQSTHRLGEAVVWYYAWRNHYLLVEEHGRWWQRWYARFDLGTRFVKIATRQLLFPTYRCDPFYRARTQGLVDFVRGRFGESPLVDSTDRAVFSLGREPR